MSLPLFLGVQLILYFVTGFCHPLNFWKHTRTMDSHGRFHLSWTVEGDSITFMVEARTKGYVGFGLSRSGSMAESDIVTGWIADGVAEFQDRHGLGEFMPVIDEEQNWELLQGYENETHTSLIFTRKLNTCDKLDDMKIDGRTYRLIYAFSEEDPPSPDELTYHSSFRGSKSVSLINPKQQSNPSTSGLMQWDARSYPYTLHSETRTKYWCTIVRGPELQKKHHILSVAPLIEPKYVDIVHHIGMYECHDENRTELEEARLRGGFHCHQDQNPLLHCNRQLLVWYTLGEQSFMVPSDAGFPLPASPPKYYKFEAHFDNYRSLEGVVLEPALRLFFTSELRKYDAGILTVGTTPSHAVFRPPGQSEYTVVGHLNPKCLEPVMPPEGIKFFAVTLHQHKLGRRMKVRHFRNEIELPVIAENQHYDFQHQDFNFLNEEVSLLKGDQITVECTTDTSSRTKVTFDGGTSDDEMCQVGILYYPLIERRMGLSHPSWTLISKLTGVLFENDDELFEQRMSNLNWNNINVTALEYELRNSPQITYCVTFDGPDDLTSKELISYPENLKPFVDEDLCPLISEEAKMSSGQDYEPLSSNFI